MLKKILSFKNIGLEPLMKQFKNKIMELMRVNFNTDLKKRLLKTELSLVFLCAKLRL